MLLIASSQVIIDINLWTVCCICVWVLVLLVWLQEISFIFQEFLYPDARDRQFLLFFHKLSKRKIFDIKRYNEIKDAINQIEGNLKVLRSPLFLHLPENARTELLGNVDDKDDEKKNWVNWSHVRSNVCVVEKAIWRWMDFKMIQWCI